MNKKQLVRTGKFIALVLRHKPETIGLVLDERGRAKISSLITKMNSAGVPITREDLDRIVETDDKGRYVIDGDYIYAAQGHSIDVDVPLEELEPPELLYHGTAWKNIGSIFKTGITPRERRYVHLSKDIKTAVDVGKRHGKPSVLIVMAGQMHRNGMKFYISKNGVWLTKSVPTEYVIQS